MYNNLISNQVARRIYYRVMTASDCFKMYLSAGANK
jgi:hypothetical protein